MIGKLSSPSSRFTRSQTLIIFTLLIVLLSLAFSLGYCTRLVVEQQFGEFTILQQAYYLLQDHAYGTIPEFNKLEYGMIRGMLQAYGDPYSSLFEPAQATLQSNRLEGKFGGIGVRLDRDKENNVLLYALPDSPALKAGIQEGDQLRKIDQLSVTPQMSMDEIQAAIRGPVGSSVRITIVRASGTSPLEMKITRAEVSAPSVTSNLSQSNPEVGVIQLSVMAQTSSDELIKAVGELSSRGGKYFVLDLRNNGGGLVDAGVNTARLFLGKDAVIIQEQFRGETARSFDVTEPGKLADIPLVVLVNQNTASAAEILAGALQAQGRAKIIGTRTYGKDSVQLVFDLRDKSSLHITTGKWWLPGQQGLLGGKGLQPDVLLSEGDANSGAALDTAIQQLIH